MLPVYTVSDGVHHRHHQSGVTASGVYRYFSGRRSDGGSSPRAAGRRGRCQIAIQVIVVCCVLFPLLFLLSDRVVMPASRGQGRWSNRKALMDPVPIFPAAHLRNLVLVAGHAVYTSLDFSLATKESSWFLEEYQKVPGTVACMMHAWGLGSYMHA